MPRKTLIRLIVAVALVDVLAMALIGFRCRRTVIQVQPVQPPSDTNYIPGTLPPLTPGSDQSGTIRALQKRISELTSENAGLLGELTKAKAQHAGTVTDTVLKKVLDKRWPLVEVKAVLPHYVVWSGYKDGVLTDGSQKVHARRITIIPDSTGGVTIKQPVVELGVLARLEAGTKPDSLAPHFDLAGFVTLSRGPLTYGLGVGWSGKPEIRAMVEIQYP